MILRKSQKRTILIRLAGNPCRGVSNVALGLIGLRFGGRIRELRQPPHNMDIETGKTDRHGVVFYRLLTPRDKINWKDMTVKP